MLITDLLLKNRIETTLAKAKSVQPLVEKIVTKAVRGNSSDIYEIRKIVRHREAYKNLIGKIAPEFSSRPGGYTRLIKTGLRRGDSAQQVLLEFVTGGKVNTQPEIKPEKTAKAPKISAPEKTLKKRGRPAKNKSK